jgi:hypothetical protein
MKKLITILSLILILSAPIFANKSEFTWSDMEVKYSEYYEKVLDEYGADHLENLFVICKYAEDNNYKLSWEVIKNLLDNQTELEVR